MDDFYINTDEYPFIQEGTMLYNRFGQICLICGFKVNYMYRGPQHFAAHKCSEYVLVHIKNKK